MKSPVEIAPSILAANFAHLAGEIAAVEKAGATLLHVDVMDGHFVPNISIGVPVVSSLRKATNLTLDVHLMIERPERFVDAFADAGADWISVHQEATPHLDRVLAQIKDNGCRAGAVVNPSTPVATLSDVLDKVDFVLVMSVNPGFGGQKFIASALRKMEQLRDLRTRHNLSFQIEVDGGITVENVAAAARSGAQILVAGTSVFHGGDAGERFKQLKQLAHEAISQKV